MTLILLCTKQVSNIYLRDSSLVALLCLMLATSTWSCYRNRNRCVLWVQLMKHRHWISKKSVVTCVCIEKNTIPDVKFPRNESIVIQMHSKINAIGIAYDHCTIPFQNNLQLLIHVENWYWECNPLALRITHHNQYSFASSLCNPVPLLVAVSCSDAAFWLISLICGARE